MARTGACIAACNPNWQHFLAYHARHPFTDIIAIDGGYRLFERPECAHIAPTLAVGDFDSLGFVPPVEHILSFPEVKDDSDLALALDWAAQQDFESVLVYGAFAGRFDHSLAALSALESYAVRTKHAVHGVTDPQANEYLTILPPDACLRLIATAASPALFAEERKDARAVSVLSLTDELEGVCLQGLKYTAHDICLQRRKTLGLSNEIMQGCDASISFRKGSALVVHPLDVPFAIQYPAD